MWRPPLPHTPPLSSKPTASSPYISRVDYKGRFDKGAFWVSDNHIIILLKSVLIVSKLLVRVSNPCDLGRGGDFWTNTFSLKAVLYEWWGGADSGDWYTFICKVALASRAGPLSCRIAIKQPPRVPIEDDSDGQAKFSHKGHIASLYRSPASQQKPFLLSCCAFLTYRVYAIWCPSPGSLWEWILRECSIF